MEEDRKEAALGILHLTLEAVYLLTGEAYVVTKKGPNPAPSPERGHALKIQELTNRIMELLTAEVCRYMEQCRSLPPDHTPPAHDAPGGGPLTPIKSGPRSGDPGNPRKADADPPAAPSSPALQEDLRSQTGGRADLPPPSAHAQHSPAPVKAEPQREGAVESGSTPHRDHTQLTFTCLDDHSDRVFMDLPSPACLTQRPPLIKEEVVVRADEGASRNDLPAATVEPSQYRIIIKEEPYSSDEDDPLVIPAAGNGETGSGEEDSVDAPPPSLIRARELAAQSCDSDLRRCHECGESFSSRRELEEHHALHKGRKPHVCSHCGKSFSYQSQLLIHERTHTGEKPFTCPDCGKCFNQLVHLGIHQMSHTGEKPYTCGQCGKSFNRKTTLTIHQRVHTGEKPFYCADCGKYFSTSSNLIKHQRVHTGEKPYACPDCGQLFVHYTQLIRHQASHARPGAAAQKMFSCSECGESFAQKSQHAKHQRSHKDGGGFPCAVCGQCFKQHKRFLSHQCVRGGEERFQGPDYTRVPGTQKTPFLL